MPFRLPHALVLSVALHLLTLALTAPVPARRAEEALTPAQLEVLLKPPPAVPQDQLLKDTMAKTSPSERPSPAAADDPLARRRAAARAERRLAEHVYYPQEAIDRGLEGEVRLLVTLDGTGRIMDIQVAASSGHAILDQAALQAARSLGTLPGTGRSEIFLPVRFQLR